jgi:hypothetical protein
MKMIENLASLTSWRRWFYFLRFLRMTISGTGRKVDAFRMNTAEVIEQLLNTFEFREAAQAVREMVSLVMSVVSSEKLQLLQRQFPFLGEVFPRPSWAKRHPDDLSDL